MKGKVFVYKARQGDPYPLFEALQEYFGVENVGFIDAARINAGELVNDEIKMLVIPGGGSANYAKELKGEGNRNIERYVALGGRLMGICAGAYYLSREFDYEGRRVKNELGLVNVFAQGVIKDFKREAGIWAATAQIVKTYGGEKISSVYIAGPRFEVDSGTKDVDVLASYADLKGTNPSPLRNAAVIQAKYKKGGVMLIGPHVEMDRKYLETHLPALGERCVRGDFKDNLRQILASENSSNLSKAFFYELLQRFTGIESDNKQININ